MLGSSKLRMLCALAEVAPPGTARALVMGIQEVP